MSNFHKEKWIQNRIVAYLEGRGYKITKKSKLKSHGVDIKCYHPKQRRYYFIEVKPEPKGENKNAQRESYFLNALGEIICRMKQRHARYGIGLPKNKSYINKIDKIPKRVRKLLNLDIFLVDRQGNVEIRK